MGDEISTKQKAAWLTLFFHLTALSVNFTNYIFQPRTCATEEVGMEAKQNSGVREAMVFYRGNFMGHCSL